MPNKTKYDKFNKNEDFGYKISKISRSKDRISIVEKATNKKIYAPESYFPATLFDHEDLLKKYLGAIFKLPQPEIFLNKVSETLKEWLKKDISERGELEVAIEQATSDKKLSTKEKYERFNQEAGFDYCIEYKRDKNSSSYFSITKKK